MDILFKQESYEIVGACFEVYKDKGNGFLEAVYQEALALEFQKQRIPFAREAAIEISYKKHKLDTVYRADFLCFDEVIVETKTCR